MKTNHRAPRLSFNSFVVPSCVAFAAMLAIAGCKDAGKPKPPTAIGASAGGDGSSAASAAPAAPTSPHAASSTASSTATPAAKSGASGADGAPAQAGGFKVSGPQDDPTVVEVGGLTMKKPATWVWTAPTMAFRALQYAVPAQGIDAPAAELVFSVFSGGDGGPVDANLDRWAGQFRTADGSEAAPSTRSKSTQGDLTISHIESKGAYMGMGQAAPRPGQMQLGAIVQAPGRNVFIKLVGAEATVESNRAAFNALLESMK
ncbi:MAG: hypothetical protein JNK53_05590 [Phycisphaerae bacterium]|nr:hypothetical protein [Phycisphaerae bacterium]